MLTLTLIQNYKIIHRAIDLDPFSGNVSIWRRNSLKWWNQAREDLQITLTWGTVSLNSCLFCFSLTWKTLKRYIYIWNSTDAHCQNAWFFGTQNLHWFNSQMQYYYRFSAKNINYSTWYYSNILKNRHQGRVQCCSEMFILWGGGLGLGELIWNANLTLEPNPRACRRLIRE